MNASDITLLTLIILIFAALYIVNVLAIGVENVKRNWPKYRCNPSIMPFAGTFGHNPVENFTYCLQTIQTNYMGYLMQPFEYNLSVIGKLGAFITGSIQKVREFFAYLRDMITSIVQNIFGVFLNLIIEFQKVLIGIKDLFSKLIGILATLLYVLSGSIDTAKSAWNGPPGKMVRYVGKLKI